MRDFLCLCLWFQCCSKVAFRGQLWPPALCFCLPPSCSVNADRQCVLHLLSQIGRDTGPNAPNTYLLTQLALVLVFPVSLISICGRRAAQSHVVLQHSWFAPFAAKTIRTGVSERLSPRGWQTCNVEVKRENAQVTQIHMWLPSGQLHRNSTPVTLWYIVLLSIDSATH